MPLPNSSETQLLNKKSTFKYVKKYCLECLSELKLNNNRDIKRKNFCSRECLGKFNQKQYSLFPPKHEKEKKECSDCSKNISRTSKNNLCRTCFNKSKSKLIFINCMYCGISFKRTYSLTNGRNVFCSKECFNLWKKNKHSDKKKSVFCKNCGKEFTRFNIYLKNNSCCSRKCSGEYYWKINDISKCFFYIDGRTKLSTLIRNSGKFDLWRKEVYEKDNFSCVECGSKKQINAHHIKEFYELLEEFLLKNSNYDVIKDKRKLLELSYNYDDFWNVRNGITLCFYCHKKRHPFLNKLRGD